MTRYASDRRILMVTLITPGVDQRLSLEPPHNRRLLITGYPSCQRDQALHIVPGPRRFGWLLPPVAGPTSFGEHSTAWSPVPVTVAEVGNVRRHWLFRQFSAAFI